MPHQLPRALRAVLPVFALAVTMAAGLTACLKVEGPFQPDCDTAAAPAGTGTAQAGPIARPDADTGSPAGEGAPVAGGELRRHFPAEPPTLNQVLDSRDIYSAVIGDFVSEALVRTNSATLEIEPLLAERWEFSPDRLATTFYLRKNVKFHNGDPFTADDVVFTWKAVFDTKHDTSRTKNYLSELTAVEKLDDFTVRFKWKTVSYLALDWVEALAVMPHKVFEGQDFNSHPANREIIGTGPYRFREWVTGQQIIIERNPDYWGQPAYIERITFRFITDDTTSLQVFKQGDLDVYAFTAEQWFQQHAKFENNPKYRVIKNYIPAFSYIGWNNRKAPFDDYRVRQAMTYAVNRAAWVETIYHGLARVIDYNQVTQEDYVDPFLKPREFSLDKARALLALAGWTDSDNDGLLDKDGKPFTFEFLTPAGNPIATQIVQYLQADLAKIGVKMEIQQFEWGTYIQKVREHKFDAQSSGWYLGSSYDPYDLWHSASANGGANYVGFSNPEADKLCENIRLEFDPALRKSMSRRLHGILYREQPYTFLFQRMGTAVVDARLGGVASFPIMQLYDSRDWWIKDPALRAAGSKQQ